MSVLECRDLTKRFSSRTALDRLNLTLPAGRIVGLLGPNGSGKTTLIKIICGLLTADEGTVLVDGHAPGIEAKRRIAYLPDRPAMGEWMSPADLIAYFADFYPDFQAETAAEMITRLGVPFDGPVRALSKGNREKVQLSLVMSRRARLYLLDEPIGGVDPAARDFILRTIISNYNQNSTVLISTHLIADVENVLDDVVFIREGQILLHDSVDNLREQHGKSIDLLFREVFA
ncbi:MAG: ABC transporter ATP-binding protein [Clostridia bacterium]|nr:ABC transporter ATP-binding protein [Clostridia bacterium]